MVEVEVSYTVVTREERHPQLTDSDAPRLGLGLDSGDDLK